MTQIEGRTSSRLEHIDVPVGEGYARFHIIRRHVEPEGFDARYSMKWYRPAIFTYKHIRNLFDTAKRKLLFWR